MGCNLDILVRVRDSLVSMKITPQQQMDKINSILANEVRIMRGLSSRMQREAVTTAIEVIPKQLLKQRVIIPASGLVLFCGVCEENGKSKVIMATFEPRVAVSVALLMYDRRFRLEFLEDTSSYRCVSHRDDNDCLYLSFVEM